VTSMSWLNFMSTPLSKLAQPIFVFTKHTIFPVRLFDVNISTLRRRKSLKYCKTKFLKSFFLLFHLEDDKQRSSLLFHFRKWSFLWLNLHSLFLTSLHLYIKESPYVNVQKRPVKYRKIGFQNYFKVWN